MKTLKYAAIRRALALYGLLSKSNLGDPAIRKAAEVLIRQYDSLTLKYLIEIARREIEDSQKAR